MSRRDYRVLYDMIIQAYRAGMLDYDQAWLNIQELNDQFKESE